MITIYSRRGTPLHESLCDAVLDQGGYTLVDGYLFEVLVAEHVPQMDAFRWRLQMRPHAGLA